MPRPQRIRASVKNVTREKMLEKIRRVYTVRAQNFSNSSVRRGAATVRWKTTRLMIVVVRRVVIIIIHYIPGRIIELYRDGISCRLYTPNDLY